MRRALANILRLGAKEILSIRRDLWLVVLIAWAFTAGIHAAATGKSMELRNAPIAVVDADRSPLSERIVGAFYGPTFRTPDLIGPADVDPGMDGGRYTFVLDIPAGFGRDVLAGRSPVLQLNVDATQMSHAFIGSGYINAIVTGEVAEYLRRARGATPAPVELVSRVRFNPALSSIWFGAVMEFINNITMLAIVLAGAALIREREHGTIEHLLVMPLTPFEIMAAKVWANGLVVLVAAALSLRFMVEGVLQVPVAGSRALFLTGTALHLMSTTSIGIFLATLARSMPQFGLLMIMTLLPLQILSGAVTPQESMPDLVRQVMQLAPTTHFVSFSQAILYRGAGLEVVWPQLLAIAGIGAAFFTGAQLQFRRTIAAQPA